MKIYSANDSKSTIEKFDSRKTPWKSLWLSYLVQAMTGVQFSMFFTSMWPYFASLDPKADMYFFGWINSAYSVGQLIASWAFGFWNQKTMSTKQPACFGLSLMAIGNIIYGSLPRLPSHHRWAMLFARLLVGIGSGNLIVLRTYCAMASIPKDRSRAMALSQAAFVMGLSVGPAIQAMFTPIGEKGFILLTFPFNMYTLPPILLVLVSLFSIVLLIAFFKENYAGIFCDKDKTETFVVVPKYDRVAAYSCIYLWFMFHTIATSIEVTLTPLTMALYNWNDKSALLYNGILQFVGCLIDIANYALISYTRVGRIDKRKLMVCSVLFFITYYIVTLPWPFYDGPLDYIPIAENSTIEDTSVTGGCFRRFEWCSHTTRIPLFVYIFCFVVVFGFAFPYMAAPLGTVFSEILGPRKQGMMQGIFEFGGCIARCIAPIILTLLFERTGYLWIGVMLLIMLFIGLTLIVIFYRRFVPLKLKPSIGVATRYKSGVFYRL